MILILVDTELLCAGAQQVVGGALGTGTLCKIDGPFKNPIGNLLFTSFKSSEVCHYSVLNRTLVIPWVTSVPVQA